MRNDGVKLISNIVADLRGTIHDMGKGTKGSLPISIDLIVSARAAMSSLGISTDAELAVRSKVSKPTVHRFFRGRCSWESVKKICATLSLQEPELSPPDPVVEKLRTLSPSRYQAALSFIEKMAEKKP